jgi:hypothetical protein
VRCLRGGRGGDDGGRARSAGDGGEAILLCGVLVACPLLLLLLLPLVVFGSWVAATAEREVVLVKVEVVGARAAGCWREVQPGYLHRTDVTVTDDVGRAERGSFPPPLQRMNEAKTYF